MILSQQPQFRFVAIWLIFTAVVVQIGWFLEVPGLVQVKPTNAPMQFNTALTFMLMGLAIGTNNQKKIFQLFLALSTIFPLITIFQYLGLIATYPDSMFVEPFIFSQAPYPGRMSGLSAGLFLLTSICLLLTRYDSSKHAMNALRTGSLICLSLSTLELLGYMFETSLIIGWGLPQSMSIFSTISFFIISTSLFGFTIFRDEAYTATWDLIFPFMALIFCILFMLVLWFSVSSHQNDRMKGVLEGDFSEIKNIFLTSLDNIFLETELSYQRNNREHSAFASDLHIIGAISYKSSPPVVTLFNESRLGDSLALKKCSWKKAHESAAVWDEHLAYFGSDIICLDMPSALLLAVIDAKNALEFLIPDDIKENYHVSLKSNDEIVYRSLNIDENYVPAYRLEEPILPSAENALILSIEPSNRYLSFLLPNAAPTVFFPGGVVSFLIILIVYYWAITRVKNNRLSFNLEKLSESRKRINSLIKNSPEPLMVLNNAGQVQFCNIHALRLWGYTQLDILGKPFSALLSKSTRKAQENFLGDYFHNPEISNMSHSSELRILRSNGEEVSVEIYFSPTSTADGQVHTIATIQDISEKTKASEKLLNQANNINLIYQTISLTSDLEDQNSILQICVDIICENFQFPVGHVFLYQEESHQLATTDIWYCLSRQDIQSFIDATKSLRLNKGEGLPGRTWASRNIVWVPNIHQDHTVSRPADSQNTKIITGIGVPFFINKQFAGVFEFFTFDEKPRDESIVKTLTVLSEQISQILEKRETFKEIKVAEQQNRLLLESAEEGICGIDALGKITFINSKGLDILGYEMGDLEDQHAHYLFHHSYSDGSPFPIEECPIHKAIIEHKTQKVNKDVFWKKNGSPVWVKYIASPILADSKIKGVVLMFNDISKLEETEAQVKSYYNELKVIEDEIQSLGEYIKKDMKEPVRGIKNFSNFLATDCAKELSESGHEYSKTLVSLSERLNLLLEGLYRYTQMALAPLSISNVDLNATLASASTYIRSQYPNADIRIETSKELPIISCDSKLIREVFRGLIDNAVKYNVSPIKTVIIDFKEDANEYTFSVQDNGLGIPEKHIIHLFRLFKACLKNQNIEPGAGISLGLASKIVARHGGKIWLDELNRPGSLFYFTLPKS